MGRKYILKKQQIDTKKRQKMLSNSTPAVLSMLIVAAFGKSLNKENFDAVCHESQDGYAVFVPHPYDCSLYYECVGLTPVLMSCPSGLFFDSRIDTCNWPEYVDCEVATTTTTTITTPSTTTSTSTTAPNTTTTPSPTTSTSTTSPNTTTTPATTTSTSTTPTTTTTTPSSTTTFHHDSLHQHHHLS